MDWSDPSGFSKLLGALVGVHKKIDDIEKADTAHKKKRAAAKKTAGLSSKEALAFLDTRASFFSEFAPNVFGGKPSAHTWVDGNANVEDRAALPLQHHAARNPQESALARPAGKVGGRSGDELNCRR